MENSNEKKTYYALLLELSLVKIKSLRIHAAFFFPKINYICAGIFHIIIDSTKFTASQSVEIEAKKPGDWKKVRRASAGFPRLVCTSLLKIYS